MLKIAKLMLYRTINDSTSRTPSEKIPALNKRAIAIRDRNATTRLETGPASATSSSPFFQSLKLRALYMTGFAQPK